MSKTTPPFEHDDFEARGAGFNAPDDNDGRSLSERARPIPRISIQAFVETSETAEAIKIAQSDRRLSKTHVLIEMGGAAAAIAYYQESPTPNLIILESRLPRQQLLAELDELAQSCDPGTKVIIIGANNDVLLYRELLKRGVSEYIVAPVTPIDVMESLSSLYHSPDAEPVGQVFAFVGAKGGVGSSTICHNVAWSMSEILKSNVVIADMDLAFGTAGLDFNQDPVQGIADALTTPDRLDEVLLDRLLTTCSKHLSLFAAPVLIDRDYEVSPEACDTVIDVVRQSVPYVALDLPHSWSPWKKRMLLSADEIIITAEPDLPNLRNAKNFVDLLRSSRKHDHTPHLIINMANIPKRPEITTREFENALGLKALAVVDFDSESFGQASNNGQMIAELGGKAKAAQQFRDIAMTLANRKEAKVEKKSALAPFFEKFKLKR